MIGQVRVGHVVRAADLGGTLIFAIEGALTGWAAGLDPIGVIVVAFLSAVGGGIIRDLMLGAVPPAAIADRAYIPIVLSATLITWAFHALIIAVPPIVLVTLDAAGLSFFAVAGTQKALDRGGIGAAATIFLGTLSAVSGGLLRDVVLNEIPRVLRVDIYATAAMAAAVLVVIGRRLGWPVRIVALSAGSTCFILRMLAHHYGWHLPTL